MTCGMTTPDREYLIGQCYQVVHSSGLHRWMSLLANRAYAPAAYNMAQSAEVPSPLAF